MPNWCKNNLKIHSNGQKILDVLELLKDDKGQMTFSKFMPTPKELEDTTSPVRDTVPQGDRNELKEKYGADNWYDWHIQNWGTKWDASDSEFYKDGDDWIISFQTPWGPPMEFIKAFSKKFKDLTFELQYADEFEGQYPLGESVFIDGVEIDDGPEEGTPQAEGFADMVWASEWVDDWSELKGIEKEED